MSYEVFARKYRPQTFDDLVGQNHVSRTLKNAVARNRLAHAYLFVGPRGIGKTSTARILAKSLNCIKGPTVTPCGECDNCREIAAGNSLDVIEIDGASNNSMEDVRQLRQNVRYAPAKGHYKIYLIDEVHMLSPAAFNALLKTLEEPPEHVKFIFATTEPQKVLPTILSRCQRFDLHRIPANLIAKHLQFIAGKDMMRLMSDLIAYLRDLLVFKAKPDALKEDIEPDVQTSLARHAELVTTGHLLELLDQFAAAEGRMKWAPNKKLHLEVAIIKAIQSLGQATLDEVIEKLGELRNGGGAGPSAQPVAARADRGREESRTAKAGVSDPGYSETPSRVAETSPDANELWQKILAKIPGQKAFVRNSASAAHVLGIDGRNFQIGFAPGDKAMMDILATQANRKLLETLLHEITGKDWSVRLTLKEGLPSRQESVSEHSQSEKFKEDPLIQEAIGLFNAQIKS